MNAIRWEAPPDVTNSSYEEIRALKGDIQEATGASSYIKGMEAEGQTRTASGINMMQAAASARFNLKVRLIESMFIEKLARMLISLDQQFISKPRVVRIVGMKGQEFRQVTPEDVKGNFDFIPTGSVMLTNREVRLQQYLMLKKVFGMDPSVNQYTLNKMIFKATGEKNIDELLLKSPQEIAAQAQQMQLARGGMGSGAEGSSDEPANPPAPPQVHPPVPNVRT
jgi:hypothetical protein